MTADARSQTDSAPRRMRPQGQSRSDRRLPDVLVGFSDPGALHEDGSAADHRETGKTQGG